MSSVEKMARTKKEVLFKAAALLRQQTKIKKKIKRGKGEKPGKTDSAVKTRPKHAESRAASKPCVSIVNTRSKRAQQQTGSEPDEDATTDAPDVDVTVNSFKCNDCEKSYTSLSNLNQHIKTSHDNGEGGVRRYFCPFCDEEQSSKFSHKRHIERKHGGETVDNFNEHEFTKTAENLDLSDAAKDALIKRLKKENEKQKREIACLTEKLQAFESVGIPMQQRRRKLRQSTCPEVSTEIGNCSSQMRSSQPNHSKKISKKPKNSVSTANVVPNHPTEVQPQSELSGPPKRERKKITKSTHPIPETVASKSSRSIRLKKPNRQPHQPKSLEEKRSRKVKIEANTADGQAQSTSTRIKRPSKPKKDTNFIYTS